MPVAAENLGPAERILQTITSFTDHAVHNRPGLVKAARNAVGATWEPAIWVQEGDEKVVYALSKAGRKNVKTRVGTLSEDMKVQNGRLVGDFRNPGLFPEVVTWMYQQIAEVYKLDNELAARFASWSFPREHRDLKVILAAFMLVQNRFGEPIIEDEKVVLHDEDYRDVGEAMCLIRGKDDINPKLLLRVGDVLSLPAVRAINQELGFGKSAKNPAMGRYYKVVEKWLRHREQNPKMLEGLVKAGFRSTVMDLARKVGFKPMTPAFFEILRWKQSQATDGRRTMAIGVEVKVAESWRDLSEEAICEKIVTDKPNFKRIIGLLPNGWTRAIMAAAVEANCLSGNDLIILTPTLEELGLLTDPEVGAKWKAATEQATNQRAANVARNVQSKAAREGLQTAADNATKAAFVEVTKGMRVFCVVDKSGSMEGAIDRAKSYVEKFLQGFPADSLHVSIFNTMGAELNIKTPTKAGVSQAFRGHTAGGGTIYGTGIRALSHHVVAPDEDLLILFVGDQQGEDGASLAQAITQYGFSPVAFGLLEVRSNAYGVGTTVVDAARHLQIPCFNIDENMFSDPYATTRVLRDLIASTPVGKAAGRKRVTLLDEVLKTDLLQKPVWA